MTGMYVRARTDDGWDNVEIERLPDADLERLVGEMPEAKARAWVLALARWIRDNVRATAVDRGA